MRLTDFPMRPETITINIPNHAEEFLSLRYGNWQIPEQNYDAGLHDGSIAEKGF